MCVYKYTSLFINLSIHKLSIICSKRSRVRTKIDFVNGRTQREGRVAVKGVEDLVLDLTDGVAVQDAALNLLFELFRRQGDRLSGVD